ncbi:DUF2309 domain-containing protein [Galbibacter mesophilus]|uniref:DUF2309 domain-containing protein n=1 Tax=Galbibacter mesophilus TaxID=379069 RepID=UPI00191F7DC5|nr:DUF2309 domain-containing protein [Galbibacter mesophilus]MCM5662398.1 DUF2309 domain-containing protein [Galbibacter mesophilus]
MKKTQLFTTIDAASKVVGKTWPLYSFVTSNPLSGYENMPFQKAIEKVENTLGANAMPSPEMFRKAWEGEEINRDILSKLLLAEGYKDSPEHSLSILEAQRVSQQKNENHQLDQIVTKWLGAFMDEGVSEWQMPNRQKGFYAAWRALAPYDSQIKSIKASEIPKTKTEALLQVLSSYSEEECGKIMEYHLAALPGWTGYIKLRVDEDSLWHKKNPITLEDYLAVRLWIAHKIGTKILPKKNENGNRSEYLKLAYIWLKAWEKSWQQDLTSTLRSKAILKGGIEKPDAQMVFCIDTRSEAIRRHVESQGKYETFGYAGFFGIAMDYENMEDGNTRKSCPPIVNSSYKVSEASKDNQQEVFSNFKKKIERRQFGNYFLRRLKNMLPSAFGYVETTGAAYGVSLLLKTLVPDYLYRFNQKNKTNHEHFCDTKLTKYTSEAAIEEKAGIVKAAFDLMGWEEFAPLVLFVGHGSHSSNNAFSSSLECGACAASPGRHNARMLASLANDKEVRGFLQNEFELSIPNDTVFIGAEHNTTTDEIVLFDADVPETHLERLKNLKNDLLSIQKKATQERLQDTSNSVAKAQRKANDWTETRPEWGLAKNATFIIAPRALTKSLNLRGRSFLHSYNWELDSSGAALEGIMQGPMVVTQWINNHYYFATVNNEAFGGGSKITHNITGKFGAVTGNGGDLKIGLPLQSLMETDDEAYHQPLRLSVCIQAPIKRIEKILEKNPSLKNLFENEWIYLMVMDPEDGNKIKNYEKGMVWGQHSASIAGRKKERLQQVEDSVLMPV